MGRKCKDLTGQRFGNLVVLGRINDHINPNGEHVVMYRCKCDCGKEVSVRGGNLRSGKTQSCGCKRREIGEKSKKTNSFIVDGNTVKVKLSNANEWMEMDVDKWEKIGKQKCWRLHQGYAATWDGGKLVLCHVMLFPDCPNGMVRDHIDGNRLNNKRANVRFVTQQQNAWNHKNLSSCKSGISGVYKQRGRWRAHLFRGGQHISLGMYGTKDEAIKARELGEIQYFGEYRRKDKEISTSGSQIVLRGEEDG